MVSFKKNVKLKLLIVVGTCPEMVYLVAVLIKCRKYFDVILAHTSQNYDYKLNAVFFKDLNDLEVYPNAVDDDLSTTISNIIDKSYKLMFEIKPDAFLVLGDTNSCLSVIGANAFIFLSFIWKPVIAVLPNVFLKKPAEEFVITNRK